MNIESVLVAELHEDPANVRRHDQRNLDTIIASLAAFGQQKPIVVGDGNVVIAGNGTLAAARALGWDHIQIVRTDLHGANAIAFAIADNRTAELAAWDDESLHRALDALRDDPSVDHLAAGFTDDEIAAMSPELAVDEVEEDDVPEPPADPITKPGDIWLLGAYWECEDCKKRYTYDEGKEMDACSCG